MRRQLWAILGVLVFIFVVYLTVGISYLNSSGTSKIVYIPLSHPEKLVTRNNIILSKEYSFKFNKTRVIPRSVNVDRILQIVNSVYGNIFKVKGEDLSFSNGKQSVRREEGFSNKPSCGIPEIIRSRRYIAGYNSPSSTVDIKTSFGQSLSIPNDFIRKAYKVANNGTAVHNVMEKLEQDIHVCSSKYSRETRVFNLPVDFTFKTCGDIAKFFPLYHIKPSLLDARLAPEQMFPWWVLKHDGVGLIKAFGDTEVDFQFESTFTFQYSSKYDSIAGTLLDDGDNIIPTSNSEYSLRVFSSNGGKGPWARAVVDLFDSKFTELIAVLEEDIVEPGCN